MSEKMSKVDGQKVIQDFYKSEAKRHKQWAEEDKVRAERKKQEYEPGKQDTWKVNEQKELKEQLVKKKKDIYDDPNSEINRYFRYG